VVATNGVPKLKDLERFAQFLLEILEQYSDRFDYIELWNEPDNRVNGAYRNGSNQGVSMQMLIEGVSAATMYGKKIVLGGMNLTDPLASHPWIMDSDILESLDVITARVFPGAWNDPDNTWCGWPTTLLGLKPHVFDYKIWITETGCATPTENHEEVQVQQLWDVVSGTAGAERVYWYTLLDLPNMYDDLRSSIGGHRESPCSFGLVAPDGRHKPAFDAMKELLHS
jgi:CDP-paratose 2-epimerase